jgi:cation:H+ antiporter
MGWLAFAAYSVWTNLLIFALSALIIWIAGTKLERYADVIAHRTGLGSAFAGLVLLAGATSLPEIATTVTASANGNATLAVNNLMGGVAMQTAVLAVADWSLARGRLTFITPSFGLLLQGVALVLLLGIAIAAMAVGDLVSVAGVGFWPLVLMLCYLYLLYEIHRYQGNPRWQPVDTPPLIAGEEIPIEADGGERQNATLRMALLFFAIGSMVVLAAGSVIAHVAEVLTVQLQISAGFVGAVLVAVSTSLPELSTTTAAVRHGHYTTAISNIFGTNMLEVALLFIADLFFRQGSIIQGGGQQAIFMASLGLILTVIYLRSMLERKEKTVGRIGADSALVLLLYLGGVALLLTLG